MRLLEAVDEAQVVAAFLRAELESERFGEELRAALRELGGNEPLVTDPDLGDAAANELRRRVLSAYRGDYLGTRLEALDGLAWRRAALTPGEVLAIRYIAWDYWLEVSGGTRLPTDAATRFRRAGADKADAEIAVG